MELDLVPGVNLGLRGALSGNNLGGGGWGGAVVVGGLLGAAGAAAGDDDRRRGVAVAHRAVRRRGSGAVAVAPAPARARARARPAAQWFTHGAVVWCVAAWWYDGAMAGQMGMAENPAGGHVRSQGHRDPPITGLWGGPRGAVTELLGVLAGSRRPPCDRCDRGGRG